jgi:hypothetical protein
MIFLRRLLFLTPLVFVILLASAFLRFPHIMGSPLPEIGISVSVAGIISVVSLLAARSLATPTDAARWGFPLGIVLSLVWVSYILVSHLALDLPAKATTGALLTTAVLSVSALAFGLAGFVGSWQSMSFMVGWGVGWWSGLAAGLASAATTLVMLLVGMGFLVRYMNPSELAAFHQSSWGDRASWYFWQEEVAGMLGLFLTLVIGGVLCSGLGSILGKVLGAADRRAHLLPTNQKLRNR